MGNRRTSRRKQKKRLEKHRNSKSILKQNYALVNAKKHIKNLSNHVLSKPEILALGKGLKFVPQQSTKRWKITLLNDFDKLSRKMRCKFELDTGVPKQLHPFYTNSNYDPPPANNAIESYIFSTKTELDNMEAPHRFSNMTHAEWLALKSLKNNNDIVIKKADKNRTVIIMNKLSYIKEGNRQLQNIHYQQIPNCTTDHLTNEVKTLIQNLKSTNQIDKTTHQFLINGTKNNRCGRLYLLPKIHKLPNHILDNLDNLANKSDINIVGRPIISQINTPTERIGKLLDYFLGPAIRKQDTYIRDSTDLLNILENTICPHNTTLCSYDLSSMYTNMNIQELINVLDQTYDTLEPNDYAIPIINKAAFMNIVEMVLTTNEFEFAGLKYIQRIGCAMGAKPSGHICDARAYQFIESIINKFPHKDNIFLHKRFRDDGLILINTDDQSQLHQLFEIANNEHELLKFTYEISQNHINFLDITIYKGQRFATNSILDTKSFIKPTETYQYLHRTSAHPNSVHKAIIKGETLRHIKLNSDQENLYNILSTFEDKLTERGYKRTEITNIINKTLQTPRTSVLKPNRNNSDRHSTPLTMVTRFHPFISNLSKILKIHWSKITNDPDANQLFTRPPIVAFKRNKNISDIITSSTITMDNQNTNDSN